MGKIIKKELRRSIPWLTIFFLVSSTVIGLVFNFDLTLRRDGAGLDVKEKIASADDTATTSVRVLNAPPDFTSGPAEYATSTPTSPVNVGDLIGFTAIADDPENNDYYLIVCTTDSVSPGAGGGTPSCGGVQLCVSTSTVDTDRAYCYHTVTDPPGQSREWYAFLCDNHATEADCTEPGDQGSGDSGSPFYINHRPVFSEVTTTVDNQPPGGSYTVTASTTDNDTEGGNDEQHIYVCLTDSWATSTGCAIELCHGTSTAPADPSCSFATTTPAKDGSYTYYGYVMDWHYFSSSDNPRTNTYTVTNVAPFVINVIIQSGNNIQLALKGVSEVEASTTFQVLDYNGCSDIVSATSTIYWESATNGINCTADDDDCYQLSTASCEAVAGSCTGYTDSGLDYICTTTLAYHTQPSDPSSNFPATVWYGAGGASDEALKSSSTRAVTGVDVMTNTALNVAEDEIAYGQIRSGQNSGAHNATTTLENIGNSPIDTNVDGVDMLRAVSGVIEVYNQKYDLNPFTFPGATWYLYSTSTQLVDITAPKPTNLTLDVEDEIYWGIGIPAGKPSGEYYGSNTLAVVLDGDGW